MFVCDTQAGAVGKWQRDEVEAFCISNLVNVMTDCDEENYIMDMHFTVSVLHMCCMRRG